MSDQLPSLWRNRDFNLLWTSQVLSQFGANLSKLAFPLLVLVLTGSAVQAGIVGTAALIARLAVRLPAGVLTDRVDRRQLMLVCDALRVVAFALLGVTVMTGSATLALITAVAALEAACASIFDVAERSVLPRIVPGPQLPDAVARNHVRGAATGLAGPPAAGVLFEIGRMVPFVGAAVSYLLSFIGVMMLRVPVPPAEPVARDSILVELREGVRFVFHHPFLRAVVTIATFVNLALEGMIFILIVALQQSGVPASTIGVVGSVLGVGGLLGGLAAGVIRRKLPLLVMVLGICWVGTVMFAVDGVLAGSVLSVVPIAVVVFLLPAINSVLLGYLAVITPDRMLGRVNAVLLTTAGGLSALGPILGGFLIGGLGAGGTFVVFAAFMAVAALVATLSDGIRTMRPIEELHREQASEREAAATGKSGTA